MQSKMFNAFLYSILLFNDRTVLFSLLIYRRENHLISCV